jgi:hypothetical protein
MCDTHHIYLEELERSMGCSAQSAPILLGLRPMQLHVAAGLSGGKMNSTSAMIEKYDAEVLPFPVQPDVFAGAAIPSSLYDAWAYEYVSEPDPSDGSCVKGSLWAIGIEAAMAFCAYGIWRFLR